MIKKLIKYFFHSSDFTNEETIRKANLSVGTFLLIAYFNINYVMISYYIGYNAGLISQGFQFFFTLGTLFFYRLGIKRDLLYLIYFSSCSIVISATIFYSGGFNSFLFAWLASTPIVALLVWGKKGSVISLIFVIILILIFFFLYRNDYVFPHQIKAEYAKTFYLSCSIGLVLILYFIAIIFENAKTAAMVLVMQEKAKTEKLLLNILPSEVVLELKENGFAKARHFNHVSVIFTDFVNFTKISETMEPEELVKEIDYCFGKFDEIIEKNKLEKIKTIGDAYLAVCGLPLEDENHALNAINTALEIMAFIKYRLETGGKFDIRIGINSGSLVAGVVGVKKFAYDIWGDTVNTAARMEQCCDPGFINISENTYQLVKDQFTFQNRGFLEVKHKGLLQMYYITSKI